MYLLYYYFPKKCSQALCHLFHRESPETAHETHSREKSQRRYGGIELYSSYTEEFSPISSKKSPANMRGLEFLLTELCQGQSGVFDRETLGQGYAASDLIHTALPVTCMVLRPFGLDHVQGPPESHGVL